MLADVDGLITQALLTGDFEGAVDLCLHDNRMADAIILAIAGGQELLTKTQEKYFAKTQSKITRVKVFLIKMLPDTATLLWSTDVLQFRVWWAIYFYNTVQSEAGGRTNKIIKDNKLKGRWPNKANDPNVRAQILMLLDVFSPGVGALL